MTKSRYLHTRIEKGNTMTQFKLYGDGIHDDQPAIQEMIDSGLCEVSLPAPQKHYLITKPLVIPSCFKLKMPRYAEIKLADGANGCQKERRHKVEAGGFFGTFHSCPFKRG